MKALSLFSGAGGMDLGLHAAGIETVAMCEIDPHARSVLKEIADTHRYRLCGNGVVAPVAEWIGTRILNRMVDDDSVDE